jgi:hypothetical protein
MAIIRPLDLPPAASVAANDALIVDKGSAVQKATPSQVVDAAIPLASQAEAEAGADNAKRVTPLRVKQAISALTVSAAKLASGENGEGASLVGFKHRLGGPAILRHLRSLSNESVSALNYITANGSANDHQNLTELMALNPAEIVFPPTNDAGTLTNVSLGSQLLLTGNKTLRFLGDARVTSDVVGVGVLAVGYPTLLTATTASAITRGSYIFTVNNGAEFFIGQRFYIYDTATAEYAPNIVRWKDGNTIYTFRPINYNFATAANIRFYDLSANGLTGLKTIGGRFTNVRANIGAHAFGLLNAYDCTIDGMEVFGTGGIGITAEVSMGLSLPRIKARNTGATGLGLRNVSDSFIPWFDAENPNRDESLTFYKNCNFHTVPHARIRQYRAGEHPANNVGQAGNCVLLDERCCDNSFPDLYAMGSATYPVFINNGSDRNRFFNPDLHLADLGLVRIAASSNDNLIAGGQYRGVRQAIDTEISGTPATAAIQDDATCSGNVFDLPNSVIADVAGVKVRQLGVAGRRNRRGLPTYADNAAAIAGGLENGDQYRTATGAQMVVY